MYEAPLVRPSYYHRPVAAAGEDKRFERLLTEVLDGYTREELVEFARGVVGQQTARVEKRLSLLLIAPNRETLETYCMRERELDHLWSLWWGKWRWRHGSDIAHWWMGRRKVRQLSRIAKEVDVRLVECYVECRFVSDYTYQPYEGSRYPARYEPVYGRFTVTASGEVVVGSLMYGVEKWSDRLLAALRLHFS